jgi:hypothetical protein
MEGHETAGDSAGTEGLPLRLLLIWLVGGLSLFALGLGWVRRRWVRQADPEDRRQSAGTLLPPLLFAGAAAAALLAGWLLSPWRAVAAGPASMELLYLLMWVCRRAQSGLALQLLAASYFFSEAVGPFGTHGVVARIAEVAGLVAALTILLGVAQSTLLSLAGSPGQQLYWWMPSSTVVVRWLGMMLHGWALPVGLWRKSHRATGALFTALLLLRSLLGRPLGASNSLEVALLLCWNTAVIRGLLFIGVGHAVSLPWLCGSSLLCLLGSAGFLAAEPFYFPTCKRLRVSGVVE